MKIAIYGGSFNPPHIGHVLAATIVLNTEDIDELWFVPTHTHMMGKKLLDYEHRLEMTRIIARSFAGRVSVSRVEQRLSTRPDFKGSLAFDMVLSIVDEWPNDKFRFVIGSDLLGHFDSWDGSHALKILSPLIVIPRENYEATADASIPVLPDISSTHVRERIRKGQDVRKLVPKEVLKYISDHHLYLGVRD
jgi:nicotinate-nucleotide adenylyltransferase